MIKVGGLDFAPDELGIADDTQDDDTEITLPKPPVIIKDEVFLRVAAIAGWQNVKRWFDDADGITYVGTKADGSKGYFIPRYDRSVDAVIDLFDKSNIFFNLATLTKSSLGCFKELESRYSAYSNFPFHIPIWAESPAIALCKLLIAISEKIE